MTKRKPEPADQVAERMRRYRERKRKAGLTETSVTVPKDRVVDIHEIARQMRDGEQ